MTDRQRITEVLGQQVLADTLGSLFQYRRVHSADVVGFRFDDQSFTYRQMGDMVDRICASLDRDQVARGARLAAFMYNSPWLLALYLACASRGDVFCPLNPLLKKVDLGYILGDLQPARLFVDEEMLAVIAQTEIPASLHQPIVVGPVTTPPEGAVLFTHWLEEGRGHDFVEPAPFDPLCIMYSGGTTGLPKGVVLPQFAPVAAALRMNDVAPFAAGSNYFSVLQLSHGWTPLIAVPFCLYFGHVFCFWRWWSASRFASTVKAYGASITDPFIGMIATLLQTPEGPSDTALKGVRVIGGIGGADPVAQKHRRDFEQRFGAKVFDLYGLTEITGLVAVETEGNAARRGSSGKITKWYDVAILDDCDMPKPANEIGEIAIRPKVPFTTALGYHNKQELTVNAWRNLWIHTGDAGFVDDDGYLFFVGRKGNFVRRRGEMISVTEVESVIMSFPGIIEAAVVPVVSELGEDELRLFVASRDAGFDPRLVLDYCHQRIARFKVPRYVDRVDELPRTGTKKEIERFRLREVPLEKSWDSMSGGGQRRGAR